MRQVDILQIDGCLRFARGAEGLGLGGKVEFGAIYLCRKPWLDRIVDQIRQIETNGSDISNWRICCLLFCG